MQQSKTSVETIRLRVDELITTLKINKSTIIATTLRAKE
jgi:hypothetical protein